MSDKSPAKMTGPPIRPVLPPQAEAEILARLFTNMKISSSEIDAILEKHGVCGDVTALQRGYRKRLGQRLMASIWDETGKREVLAHGSEYVVVDCCNDQRELQIIRRRIQAQIKGLDVSAIKVQGRIRLLERLIAGFRRAG